MALINQEELNAIARLSGFSLTDDERTVFSDQLNTILEYASSLQQVAEQSGDITTQQRPYLMREDNATPFQDSAAIRALSPQPSDRYFAVPPIIE
jgi:aspartyl-tRNA(Asn)/glutamyl-tRNA(Gln) amidotransferase subunit C